jgi:hypothetical protein
MNKAHKCQCLSRLHNEADIFENQLVLRKPERNVFEFDLACGTIEIDCVWMIRNLKRICVWNKSENYIQNIKVKKRIILRIINNTNLAQSHNCIDLLPVFLP